MPMKFRLLVLVQASLMFLSGTADLKGAVESGLPD